MNRLCCRLFSLLGVESKASCLLATSSSSELFLKALFSAVLFCDRVWLCSPDRPPTPSPSSLAFPSAGDTGVFWVSENFFPPWRHTLYLVCFMPWNTLYGQHCIITNLWPRDEIVLRLHCHIVLDLCSWAYLWKVGTLTQQFEDFWHLQEHCVFVLKISKIPNPWRCFSFVNVYA